ncbi:MAG: DUF935 family protein, partial [Kiritimatiellae bacterium]|nr:DUF935 family protein [Kiritimatiellia bacterium]
EVRLMATKAKTEAARVMVLPRATKARRTGAQAWIERTNPLTRLSLRAAQSIYDTARGGGYTRLQYIYAEIEKTDPTLFTCVDRRLSALSALGWRVVANVEGTKAEAQKKILEKMLDGAVGLSAAIEHMGLAFFRGFSFCEPYMRDGRLAFNCPPSWEFNRSPDGTWWHNPLVIEGDAGGEGQTAFDPEAVIHIERVRAVDYPALALYLRHEVAEDEWGRFLERYGIPPVILEMPPLTQPGDADRFAQAAQQVYEALCGAVPNGTRVNTLAEARGAEPFSAFIEHQEKTMVRLCTGGTLGSIAEATGIGSGASDAQGDVWREIVSRDAVLIGEEFTRWFGRFVFPEGMLVRFELGTEKRATPDEVFETAAKARQAGYRFTKEYLETETGAELEEEPQQPQNPPGFGPLLNKAPAAPLQTAKNALQNAPKVSDAQGEGRNAPALLGPFSAGFEERLLDEMFKAAADELDASHAEAEANKTDAQGEELTNGVQQVPKGHANAGQFTGKTNPPKGTSREPETAPKHDRYGATDEATLASNPQKNFKRGANALDAITRKGSGYIDDAMFREESGWIRFDWGDPGDPNDDYKHGHGISHVLAKHEKDAKLLPKVIAEGKAVKDPNDSSKTLFVTDTAYAVVIPLNQSERRILTMFEPRPDSKKLEAIKNYPPAEKRGGR